MARPGLRITGQKVRSERHISKGQTGQHVGGHGKVFGLYSRDDEKTVKDFL